VTPATTNVAVNDPFSLTVEGSGFDLGMSSGGVVLSWNENNIQLTSTINDITASLPSGMLDFGSSLSAADVNGNRTATISAGGFSNYADGSGFFSFATLNFLAVPPPSVSTLVVSASTFGGWQDGQAFAQPVTIDAFNSASIHVNAVPVPAAAWLFGSGLIGLVGIARRKPQVA